MERSEWKKYQRKGLSEMRPYVKGESLDGISVSDVDDPPNDMGMIARNPKNHADQWYVARKYFEDNLEPADAPALTREIDVEGVIQRWESRARRLTRNGDEYERGKGSGYMNCAHELRSVLSGATSAAS